MTVQIGGENGLAIGLSLAGAHSVETGVFESTGVGLDDKRAHRRAVAVVVSAENAILVSAKRQAQTIEQFGRAEPHKRVL